MSHARVGSLADILIAQGCEPLFFRREMSRRRATASAKYRPCLNAFLLPFGTPGDRLPYGRSSTSIWPHIRRFRSAPNSRRVDDRCFSSRSGQHRTFEHHLLSADPTSLTGRMRIRVAQDRFTPRGRQAAAARLALGRSVLTNLIEKVGPWQRKHFASQRHGRLL